jgi:uncharacterized membrane protein YfcA
MDLAWGTTALLMGTAFVAGTIDAMAGGGGLLMIPALMAAGIPPVNALATNKLQSSLGTSSAVLAFARKGRIEFRRFLAPALAAFVGSAAGAWTLQRVDPGFLSGFVPVLLVLMAAYFLLAPAASEDDRHARLGRPALVAIMALIGFYDGFFGPGTGSFIATALVLLFGMGLLSATAHTKLLNLASNLAAVIALGLGGKILWQLGLLMALCAIAGGQLGAHLAMRVGGRLIRPLLVTVSLLLTARLLLDPHNPLTQLLLSLLRRG